MITREQFDEIRSLPIFKSRVITGSMTPIINVGDEVVIDVGNMNIKRFDIVVILLNGKLVCHYVWSMNKIVKPKLIQTRNMLGQVDFPVGEEDYLGKVISHRLSFWKKLKILF